MRAFDCQVGVNPEFRMLSLCGVNVSDYPLYTGPSLLPLVIHVTECVQFVHSCKELLMWQIYVCYRAGHGFNCTEFVCACSFYTRVKNCRCGKQTSVDMQVMTWIPLTAVVFNPLSDVKAQTAPVV